VQMLFKGCFNVFYEYLASQRGRKN